MKYSVFFHMMIGGAMFTNSRIFPDQDKQIIQRDVNKFLKELSSQRFFKNRFNAQHSQVYLAIFILILFLYCLKRFFLNKVDKFVSSVFCCGMCRKQKEELATSKDYTVQSDNIFKELDLSQLAELYKRSNRELNDYKELIIEPNSVLKTKFAK